MIRSVADGDSVSVTIVEGVAECERCQPNDLPERLADVIDPDALDALFTPKTGQAASADPMVRFTFSGYRITVTDDGHVQIEGLTKINA